MNSTSSLLNASLDDTLMPSMDDDDDDGGSQPLCYYPLYYIMLVTLAIAMFMMTVTLILIPCHRRLRKQHHIFPYNLVLSDLSGAITAVFLEGFVYYELPQEVILLSFIFLETSIMVSLLSIVLVTGYQFITIRVDPFGTRNIITTPRLIATCLVTWGISFACSCSITLIDHSKVVIVLLSLSLSTTLATGLCYIFIYRSVAKVPCGGNITQERKEQNQRVLRTFGLIFGTAVLCWICPWIKWTLQSRPGGYENKCVIEAAYIMININWIANSVIYWWRLREFRAMFCSRKNGAVNPQLPMVIDMNKAA